MEQIQVSIDAGTATVRLDNPSQRNALTKNMCLQLVGALAAVSADRNVHVVVLRGAGSSFSAGIAIDQMDQVLFDDDGFGGLYNHFDAVDRAVTGCSKPTIAVVEGSCFGGGWQLAAACDIQLASTSTQIAITPAKVGLLFPRLGLERLVQLAGASRAKYLLYSGAQISVQEAVHWGLFTKLVPAEDLELQLAHLLAQLKSNSQFAIARTGEAIGLLDALDSEQDYWWGEAWQANAHSADLAEGRRAFLEHRTPRFG